MFWDKLIELCAKKGVTVGQCMRAIGLTPGSATGWKKGGMPSEVNVRKLAEYFGVSVEYLAGERESETLVEVDKDERSEYISIIKSQQSTIADQTQIVKADGEERSKYVSIIESDGVERSKYMSIIESQQNMLASQSRIIEVMVVDNKAVKK